MTPAEFNITRFPSYRFTDPAGRDKVLLHWWKALEQARADRPDRHISKMRRVANLLPRRRSENLSMNGLIRQSRLASSYGQRLAGGVRRHLLAAVVRQ